MKLKSVFLSLALLALPGSAAAQSGVQALYFVFKLGTTLPLTVQDTPECAAQQVAWEGFAAQQTSPDRVRLPAPSLMTYSFVSPLGSAPLRLDLEAFAREHNFAATTLAPGHSAEGTGGTGQEAGRQFTDANATGFSYTVRVYERPGEAGTRSVLCVTMFSPAGPVPSEPASDDA